MALFPSKDCQLCPRLAAFRQENRAQFPDMFNAPVPSFGSDDPDLLVIGLAPGLRGANFSGRPFTGDYAGDTLYDTMVRFGFARGTYQRHVHDGLTLTGARIINAVRCVPPENKPTTQEINTCRTFLEKEISTFKNVKAIIALGTVAHNSILKTFGLKQSACKFGHAVTHRIEPLKTLDYPVTLIDSYHCSRYNVNTGRLTTEMFDAVFALARDIADTK